MSENKVNKEKPTIIRKALISSNELSNRPSLKEGMISSSDLNRSNNQTRIGQDKLISSSELKNKSRSTSGKKKE